MKSETKWLLVAIGFGMLTVFFAVFTLINLLVLFS